MYIEIIVWNWEENTSGLEEVSIFNLGKNTEEAKKEFEKDKEILSLTNAKVYLKYMNI